VRACVRARARTHDCWVVTLGSNKLKRDRASRLGFAVSFAKASKAPLGDAFQQLCYEAESAQTLRWSPTKVFRVAECHVAERRVVGRREEDESVVRLAA